MDPIRKPASARSTVRRLPARAAYDRPVVDAILDEGLVAHVAFVEDGSPRAIPMTFARVDDHLYVHGSPASRLLRSLRGGVELCLTVTLLDGLVLARSGFHHSMNYRSVVVFGRAAEVTERAEKIAALDALVERTVPGRSRAVRPVSARELAATLVLRLGLDEASAKIRRGPPVDDEADYTWPVWAGEVPLRLVPGTPIPDPRLAPGLAFPAPAGGAP